MSNPRPTQNAAFKATQFKRTDAGDKLAESPYTVRLPVDIDRALREIPGNTNWARDLIVRAYLEQFGEPAPEPPPKVTHRKLKQLVAELEHLPNLRHQQLGLPIETPQLSVGGRVRIVKLLPHQSSKWIGEEGEILKLGERVRVRLTNSHGRPVELLIPYAYLKLI